MRIPRAPLILAVLLAALAGLAITQSMAKTQTDVGPALQQLPVSLNDVMVVLVNHSADPIWVAAWRPPEDDKAWRALERNAFQLEIAGSLMTTPGTGPKDAEWAADPRWQAFSKQLHEAGRRAVEAIAARDMDAIRQSGDEIVEICEGCHMVFKPGDPTGGSYGELSPTAADFEEQD